METGPPKRHACGPPSNGPNQVEENDIRPQPEHTDSTPSMTCVRSDVSCTKSMDNSRKKWALSPPGIELQPSLWLCEEVKKLSEFHQRIGLVVQFMGMQKRSVRNGFCPGQGRGEEIILNCVGYWWMLIKSYSLTLTLNLGPWHVYSHICNVGLRNLKS